MTGRQHAARIVLLIGCAAGFLGGMAGNTAVMFNDGLRYISQARATDERGSGGDPQPGVGREGE